MKNGETTSKAGFQVQVPAGFVTWLFRKQQSIRQTLETLQCRSGNFKRTSDKSFYFEITSPSLTNGLVVLIRSILFQHLPTNLHPVTQDFISVQITQDIKQV